MGDFKQNSQKFMGIGKEKLKVLINYLKITQVETSTLRMQIIEGFGQEESLILSDYHQIPVAISGILVGLCE